MVSLTIGSTTLELTKATYSFKSKIGGHLSDTVDRSDMKIVILPDTVAAFYVSTKETLTKHRVFSVEIDGKLDIKDTDIDLHNLFDLVDDIFREEKLDRYLLDKNYNILGIANQKMDFIPYKLEQRDLKEVNVNNSYNFIDAINKDESYYFIIAFPDILVTVDRYTVPNYLFLLVKSYIENRFPVFDNFKHDNMRIISEASFNFIYYHIKSILQAKIANPYLFKSGFEMMSKMNLLPKIPETNFWIEENEYDIKSNRLKECIKRNNNFLSVVKNKFMSERKKEESFLKIPDIPKYFAEQFDDDSVALTWSDFKKEFHKWESSSKNPLDDWNYNIFIMPVIIIPDETINKIEKDQIVFFGFDGQDFYLSLVSKFAGNNLTEEEKRTKSSIETFFMAKFGYNINVVFEEYVDDDNLQTSFLGE